MKTLTTVNIERIELISLDTKDSRYGFKIIIGGDPKVYDEWPNETDVPTNSILLLKFVKDNVSSDEKNAIELAAKEQTLWIMGHHWVTDDTISQLTNFLHECIMAVHNKHNTIERDIIQDSDVPVYSRVKYDSNHWHYDDRMRILDGYQILKIERICYKNDIVFKRISSGGMFNLLFGKFTDEYVAKVLNFLLEALSNRSRYDLDYGPRSFICGDWSYSHSPYVDNIALETITHRNRIVYSNVSTIEFFPYVDTSVSIDYSK
jgi:hypothetical protein